MLSPIYGTPAYRAGILAGDRIVEIDGRSTDGVNVASPVTEPLYKKLPSSQPTGFPFARVNLPKLPITIVKSVPVTEPSRSASPSSVYLTSIWPEVRPLTTPSAPSA